MIIDNDLLLLGCLHIGSKNSDIELFEFYKKQLEVSDMEILVLGDMFENAIVSKKDMMWDQCCSPDEQMDICYKLLFPFKSRIVGWVTSNHSERSWKDVGINLDRRMVLQLGLKESLYKGQNGSINWHNTKIVFAHGAGYGCNTWRDADQLLKIYPQADIVAVSHRHEMAATWRSNFNITSDNKNIRKDVLYIRTGSLMNYARYASRLLYLPQKPGFSVIHKIGDCIHPDITGI